MKQLLILWCFLSLLPVLRAQQLPIFSNQMMTGQYNNPAAMVESRFQRVHMNYLNSATGFSDAPRSYYLSYVHPITDSKDGNLPSYQTTKNYSHRVKNALGAYLLNDHYGFMNQYSGMISYAQKFKISPFSYISFGLSTGLFSTRLDYSGLSIQQQDDQTYQSYLNNNSTALLWDANFGFLYKIKDYKIEGAIKQLLSNKALLNDNGIRPMVEPGYFAKVSTRYTIKRSLSLVPTISYFKTGALPYELLANADFIVQDHYLAGLIYQHRRSVGFRVGMIYKSLIFNYSFNYNTSKFSVIGHTNHELGLMLVINKKQYFNFPDFL